MYQARKENPAFVETVFLRQLGMASLPQLGMASLTVPHVLNLSIFTCDMRKVDRYF